MIAHLSGTRNGWLPYPFTPVARPESSPGLDSIPSASGQRIRRPECHERAGIGLFTAALITRRLRSQGLQDGPTERARRESTSVEVCRSKMRAQNRHFAE
jgi:hypothetical protein